MILDTFKYTLKTFVPILISQIILGAAIIVFFCFIYAFRGIFAFLMFKPILVAILVALFLIVIYYLDTVISYSIIEDKIDWGKVDYTAIFGRIMDRLLAYLGFIILLIPIFFISRLPVVSIIFLFMPFLLPYLFFYTPFLILRDVGPIDAIFYSFNLANGNYLYILLRILLFTGVVFCLSLPFGLIFFLASIVSPEIMQQLRSNDIKIIIAAAKSPEFIFAVIICLLFNRFIATFAKNFIIVLFKTLEGTMNKRHDEDVDITIEDIIVPPSFGAEKPNDGKPDNATHSSNGGMPSI
ncbi:MAG: hypothetical protein LBG46_03525 [Elusimicrobiota bacterium]|jgi:hypothetical protein|nr:hypothetical protein [Elusimicrobiota bacterium]